MSKRPNPTLVGTFIVGACILVVAAIAIWGSRRLFEHRMKYVCYFPGSVQGLAIGAPVKFRGVPIGEVVDMKIRFQQAADNHSIPILIELKRDSVQDLAEEHGSGAKIIEDLIGKGLRAQLQSESFVTGQLYVNLDLMEKAPPPVLVHDHGEYSEIPAVPTELEEIQKTLSKIVEQLKKIDLNGIATSLANAVEGINKLVNTPSVAKTLDELPAAVASARKLIVDVDTGVGHLAPVLVAALDQRGPTWGELTRTFADIQHAAQSVRALADFLQRNPNALLVGKKKPQ